MCINCWKEAGGHSIINGKTLFASTLIELIYQTNDGGAGGYAHVVVDDFNLSDNHIDSCLEDIHRDEDTVNNDSIQPCKAALMYLRTLTYKERVSAMAIHNNYI